MLAIFHSPLNVGVVTPYGEQRHTRGRSVARPVCGIRGGSNAVEEGNLLHSDSSRIYSSRLPVICNISKSEDYHSPPDDKMAFIYERIDKNNVALLVVDHQEGLFQMCRDRTPQEMKSSVLAHAELAKVFNLPTILTTSAETGKIQIPVKETNEERLLGCLALDCRTERPPAQGGHSDAPRRTVHQAPGRSGCLGQR